MNESVVALASITSIFGLWVLVFWVYCDYRVDSFRQDMFALRDSLFDQAADGKIAFDTPAYGLLRTTMNGFIRFGHRLTLPSFLCIAFALRGSNSRQTNTPFSRRLAASLGALDREQRHLLLDYHRKMNILLVRHLLLSSPLLVLSVFVPLLVSFTAGAMVGKAHKALSRPVDRFDTFALAEGEIS